MFGPATTQRLLAQFDVAQWLGHGRADAAAASAHLRLVLTLCTRFGPLAANDRQVGSRRPCKRRSPGRACRGGRLDLVRSRGSLLCVWSRARGRPRCGVAVQVPVLDGLRATLRTLLAAAWEPTYRDMVPRLLSALLAGQLDPAVVHDFFGAFPHREAWPARQRPDQIFLWHRVPLCGPSAPHPHPHAQTSSWTCKQLRFSRTR